MIRLIQFLIFGHVHKWEEIDRSGYKGVNREGVVRQRGIAYIQRCAHCGKMRTFKDMSQ